jgi:anthranilate synthase component 1
MDLNTYNQYVAEGYNHIPVFRTESIDTETALSLYLKQGNKPYSYLFESVEGGEKWGRFSFVGIGASKIIKKNLWLQRLKSFRYLMADW